MFDCDSLKYKKDKYVSKMKGLQNLYFGLFLPEPSPIVQVLFVCIDALRQGQQFISYMYLAYLLHCTLPDKRCLSHGMCLNQVMMTLHFLNEVANDTESTQKSKNYIIIASLKSETMGKLIN